MNRLLLAKTPKVKDLGDGFEVRRSLPDMRKQMVGPFIFWDHMGPVRLTKQNEMTVRAHPHIGLATITWLFSGEILHRDSLGNEQSIRPGEVNWMTAGKGIVHSERAFAKDPAEILEGIQLWLALSKENEDIDPSFYHCKEEEVPLIELDGIRMRLIAGESFSKKSPVPVYSELFYINAEASKGSRLQFPVKENHEAAIYIISGSLKLGASVYDQYSMLIFDMASSLDIVFSEDCKFMLFGGEVFPEPRKIWWNFVSSDMEKIEEAKRKWEAQEFDPVINETEFIPLPDK